MVRGADARGADGRRPIGLAETPMRCLTHSRPEGAIRASPDEVGQEARDDEQQGTGRTHGAIDEGVFTRRAAFRDGPQARQGLHADVAQPAQPEHRGREAEEQGRAQTDPVDHGHEGQDFRHSGNDEKGSEVLTAQHGHRIPVTSDAAGSDPSAGMPASTDTPPHFRGAAYMDIGPQQSPHHTGNMGVPALDRNSRLHGIDGKASDMHQPFDISTVVFAVLAIFVIWKLRSVLGTRTGTERPPFDPFEARRKLREGKTARDAAPADPRAGTGTVIKLPGGRRFAPPPPRGRPSTRPSSGRTTSSRVPMRWRAWSRSVRRTRNFTAESFMAGARAAYEMIVMAFAAGDRPSLKPLLAREVYDGFAAAITQRELRGHKNETTFVSTEKSIIQDAQLKGRTAQVAIRFHSKMIAVTRDRDGAVVDGAVDQVGDIYDLWTFAHEVDSRDPQLAARRHRKRAPRQIQGLVKHDHAAPSLDGSRSGDLARGHQIRGAAAG